MEKQGLTVDQEWKQRNTRAAAMWVLAEAETKNSQLLLSAGAPRGKPVSALPTGLVAGMEVSSEVAAVAAAGKRHPQGVEAPVPGVCLMQHWGFLWWRVGSQMAIAKSSTIFCQKQHGNCWAAGRTPPVKSRQAVAGEQSQVEKVFPISKPQVCQDNCKGHPLECKEKPRCGKYAPLQGAGTLTRNFLQPMRCAETWHGMVCSNWSV